MLSHSHCRVPFLPLLLLAASLALLTACGGGGGGGGGSSSAPTSTSWTLALRNTSGEDLTGTIAGAAQRVFAAGEVYAEAPGIPAADGSYDSASGRLTILAGKAFTAVLKCAQVLEISGFDESPFAAAANCGAASVELTPAHWQLLLENPDEPPLQITTGTTQAAQYYGTPQIRAADGTERAADVSAAFTLAAGATFSARLRCGQNFVIVPGGITPPRAGLELLYASPPAGSCSGSRGDTSVSLALPTPWTLALRNTSGEDLTGTIAGTLQRVFAAGEVYAEAPGILPAAGSYDPASGRLTILAGKAFTAVLKCAQVLEISGFDESPFAAAERCGAASVELTPAHWQLLLENPGELPLQITTGTTQAAQYYGTPQIRAADGTESAADVSAAFTLAAGESFSARLRCGQDFVIAPGGITPAPLAGLTRTYASPPAGNCSGSGGDTSVALVLSSWMLALQNTTRPAAPLMVAIHGDDDDFSLGEVYAGTPQLVAADGTLRGITTELAVDSQSGVKILTLQAGESFRARLRCGQDFALLAGGNVHTSFAPRTYEATACDSGLPQVVSLDTDAPTSWRLVLANPAEVPLTLQVVAALRRATNAPAFGGRPPPMLYTGADDATGTPALFLGAGREDIPPGGYLQASLNCDTTTPANSAAFTTESGTDNAAGVDVGATIYAVAGVGCGATRIAILEPLVWTLELRNPSQLPVSLVTQPLAYAFAPQATGGSRYAAESHTTTLAAGGGMLSGELLCDARLRPAAGSDALETALDATVPASCATADRSAPSQRAALVISRELVREHWVLGLKNERPAGGAKLTAIVAAADGGRVFSGGSHVLAAALDTDSDGSPEGHYAPAAGRFQDGDGNAIAGASYDPRTGALTIPAAATFRATLLCAASLAIASGVEEGPSTYAATGNATPPCADSTANLLNPAHWLLVLENTTGGPLALEVAGGGDTFPATQYFAAPQFTDTAGAGGTAATISGGTLTLADQMQFRARLLCGQVFRTTGGAAGPNGQDSYTGGSTCAQGSRAGDHNAGDAVALEPLGAWVLTLANSTQALVPLVVAEANTALRAALAGQAGYHDPTRTLSVPQTGTAFTLELPCNLVFATEDSPAHGALSVEIPQACPGTATESLAPHTWTATLTNATTTDDLALTLIPAFQPGGFYTVDPATAGLAAADFDHDDTATITLLCTAASFQLTGAFGLRMLSVEVPEGPCPGSEREVSLQPAQATWTVQVQPPQDFPSSKSLAFTDADGATRTVAGEAMVDILVPCGTDSYALDAGPPTTATPAAATLTPTEQTSCAGGTAITKPIVLTAPAWTLTLTNGTRLGLPLNVTAATGAAIRSVDGEAHDGSAAFTLPASQASELVLNSCAQDFVFAAPGAEDPVRNTDTLTSACAGSPVMAAAELLQVKTWELILQAHATRDLTLNFAPAVDADENGYTELPDGVDAVSGSSIAVTAGNDATFTLLCSKTFTITESGLGSAVQVAHAYPEAEAQNPLQCADTQAATRTVVLRPADWTVRIKPPQGFPATKALGFTDAGNTERLVQGGSVFDIYLPCDRTEGYALMAGPPTTTTPAAAPLSEDERTACTSGGTPVVREIVLGVPPWTVNLYYQRAPLPFRVDAATGAAIMSVGGVARATAVSTNQDGTATFTLPKNQMTAVVLNSCAQDFVFATPGAEDPVRTTGAIPADCTGEAVYPSLVLAVHIWSVFLAPHATQDLTVHFSPAVDAADSGYLETPGEDVRDSTSSITIPANPNLLLADTVRFNLLCDKTFTITAASPIDSELHGTYAHPRDCNTQSTLQDGQVVNLAPPTWVLELLSDKPYGVPVRVGAATQRAIISANNIVYTADNPAPADYTVPAPLLGNLTGNLSFKLECTEAEGVRETFQIVLAEGVSPLAARELTGNCGSSVSLTAENLGVRTWQMTLDNSAGQADLVLFTELFSILRDAPGTRFFEDEGLDVEYQVLDVSAGGSPSYALPCHATFETVNNEIHAQIRVAPVSNCVADNGPARVNQTETLAPLAWSVEITNRTGAPLTGLSLEPGDAVYPNATHAALQGDLADDASRTFSALCSVSRIFLRGSFAGGVVSTRYLGLRVLEPGDTLRDGTCGHSSTNAIPITLEELVAATLTAGEASASFDLRGRGTQAHFSYTATAGERVFVYTQGDTNNNHNIQLAISGATSAGDTRNLGLGQNAAIAFTAAAGEHRIIASNEGLFMASGLTLTAGVAPPLTEDVQAIARSSLSGGYACFILSSGAHCVGQNNSRRLGEEALGNNDRVAFMRPVDDGDSAGSDRMLHITAGNTQTCAVVDEDDDTSGSSNTADDTAYCWGQGRSGSQPAPVAVKTLDGDENEIDLAGVTAISAGRDFACAIADGAALCWGDDQHGRLGNGDDRSHQARAGSLGSAESPLLGAGVTAISSGTAHACAISSVASENLAWCWGFGGRVGDGSDAERQVPVGVVWDHDENANTAHERLRQVTAISAGATHTCAINDGAALCWGAQAERQLGSGGTQAQNAAVPVQGLDEGVTAISAADAHSCAIHNNEVKCWGSTADSRLGSIAGDAITTFPADLTISDFTIDASTTFAESFSAQGQCILSAGRPLCWGRGAAGVLGDGGDTSQSTPGPLYDSSGF